MEADFWWGFPNPTESPARNCFHHGRGRRLEPIMGCPSFRSSSRDLHPRGGQENNHPKRVMIRSNEPFWSFLLQTVRVRVTAAVLIVNLCLSFRTTTTLSRFASKTSRPILKQIHFPCRAVNTISDLRFLPALPRHKGLAALLPTWYDGLL